VFRPARQYVQERSLTIYENRRSAYFTRNNPLIPQGADRSYYNAYTPDTVLLLPSGISVCGIETWVRKLDEDTLT